MSTLKTPAGIERGSATPRLRELTNEWFTESVKARYSYNFTWLGRPVIQMPQDLMAMQELIWSLRPDLLIETGIAHGGSLIFYASMFELIGQGKVVGIDIEIRTHNRTAIEQHPMSKRIELLEGSSVDDDIVAKARAIASQHDRVFVVLDSNHTHDHVLRELELYSPMVTKGSYLVVFDTAIDDLPDEIYQDRPWGRGNNPKTAVREFLTNSDRFVVDDEIDSRILLTVAPGGYLRCVKD
jgi:cephalosporin hydroxylase